MFKGLFGCVHPYLEYFSVFIEVPVQLIDGTVVGPLSYPGEQGQPLVAFSPRCLSALQFSSGSGCCPWALRSAPAREALRTPFPRPTRSSATGALTSSACAGALRTQPQSGLGSAQVLPASKPNAQL